MKEALHMGPKTEDELMNRDRGQDAGYQDMDKQAILWHCCYIPSAQGLRVCVSLVCCCCCCCCCLVMSLLPK